MNLAVTPYNTTQEAMFTFNYQCPDYVRILWNDRVLNNPPYWLKGSLDPLVEKTTCAAQNIISDLTQCILKIIPMSMSDFNFISNKLFIYFNKVLSRDIDEGDQDRWETILGIIMNHKSKEFPTNLDLETIFLTPLYKADIETLELRQKHLLEQEYADRYRKTFPSMRLDRCLVTNFKVMPLTHEKYSPARGVFRYVKDCLSLSYSEFLAKVDKAVGLTTLKIIEEGVSTSLIIYDEDKEPMAIFKPSNYAGGFLDNPKGTAGFFIQDAIEQAALKEVAAARVMNGVSGAPETYLVEMNLGGTLLQGSLQEYVKHHLSIADIETELQLKIMHALNLEDLIHIFPKIAANEPLTSEELTKYGPQWGKFMYSLRSTSYGKYLSTYFSKASYQNWKIPIKEIQKVVLHKLLTGNLDNNPKNYLLTKQEDGSLLTPIDFNLAFLKDNMILPQPFLMAHPDLGAPVDPHLVDYFKKYNVKDMAHQLQSIGLEPQRIVNFILRAVLIQKAITNGLSVRETASLFIPSQRHQITLSKKLINFFYEVDKSTQSKVQIKQLIDQFQIKAEAEIVAFVARLKDPESLEAKIQKFQEGVSKAKNLREFDAYIQQLLEITLELPPHFNPATEEEMIEDEQGYCSTNIVRRLNG